MYENIVETIGFSDQVINDLGEGSSSGLREEDARLQGILRSRQEYPEIDSNKGIWRKMAEVKLSS